MCIGSSAPGLANRHVHRQQCAGVIAMCIGSSAPGLANRHVHRQQCAGVIAMCIGSSAPGLANRHVHRQQCAGVVAMCIRHIMDRVIRSSPGFRHIMRIGSSAASSVASNDPVLQALRRWKRDGAAIDPHNPLHTAAYNLVRNNTKRPRVDQVLAVLASQRAEHSSGSKLSASFHLVPRSNFPAMNIPPEVRTWMITEEELRDGAGAVCRVERRQQCAGRRVRMRAAADRAPAATTQAGPMEGFLELSLLRSAAAADTEEPGVEEPLAVADVKEPGVEEPGDEDPSDKEPPAATDYYIIGGGDEDSSGRDDNSDGSAKRPRRPDPLPNTRRARLPLCSKAHPPIPQKPAPQKPPPTLKPPATLPIRKSPRESAPWPIGKVRLAKPPAQAMVPTPPPHPPTARQRRQQGPKAMVPTPPTHPPLARQRRQQGAGVAHPPAAARQRRQQGAGVARPGVGSKAPGPRHRGCRGGRNREWHQKHREAKQDGPEAVRQFLLANPYPAASCEGGDGVGSASSGSRGAHT